MCRWISRHLGLGTAILVVIGLLFHILVFHPADAPFSVSFSPVVCVMLVWGALYLICLQRTGRRAIQALEEQCDPEPLLEFSREQLRLYNKGRNAHRPYSLTCRLNITTALTCLGRNSEAREELDRLESLLSGQPGYLHLLYCLNRSASLFQLGRAEDMLPALDRAESLLGTLKLTPAQRETAQLVLYTNRCAYRYLTEGPGPELEDIYRGLLREASTQRVKVGLHLTLGKFTLARNAVEEARPYLDYAVQYGGKLYYRQEAEKLLKGLPAA